MSKKSEDLLINEMSRQGFKISFDVKRGMYKTDPAFRIVSDQ